MKFPKKSYTKKRKKASNKTPESALQKFCEDYLELNGIAYIRIPDHVYSFIFSSSIIPVWIKKLVAAYLAGLPDLTILLKDGRYICVELKSQTGKLRGNQKRFRNMVGSDNFFVVKTPEEFM
ncbi:MAG: VRR-NUC domain-containing protein, partial [Caldisericaceae bacterium]|nr:VRR-NUC domain-containing protein [Caldisericaceae bacterium]